MLTSRVSSDPEQIALAGRIRGARATVGVTQQQVADATGIDRSAIAMIETGRRRVHALELRRLARALTTTAADLLDVPDHAGEVPTSAVTRLAAGLTPAQIDYLATYARFLLWQQARGVVLHARAVGGNRDDERMLS